MATRLTLERAVGNYRTAFEGWAHRNPSRKPYVTRFSTSDILRDGMQAFTTPDGRTGALLRDHHDGRIEVCGLFSDGPKGAGSVLVEYLASEWGANYLECFDALEPVYWALGFEVTSRSPWNPEYAPADWDESLGTPDYLTMHRTATLARP